MQHQIPCMVDKDCVGKISYDEFTARRKRIKQTLEHLFEGRIVEIIEYPGSPDKFVLPRRLPLQAVFADELDAVEKRPVKLGGILNRIGINLDAIENGL